MSKVVQNAAKNRKTTTKTVSVIKKPAVSKSTTNKPIKSKKSNQTKKTVNKDDSCIIYVGHIAHGFYEKEMNKFFSQFGNIKRLKLFRSNKTNNSKGYAFIEFDEAEVANVVADTMNGYFLQEKQLVSHVIPKEKHHKGMFLKPKKKPSDNDKDDDDKEEVEEQKEKDIDYEKQAKNFLRNQKKKQKKLETLGIDFNILMPTA